MRNRSHRVLRDAVHVFLRRIHERCETGAEAGVRRHANKIKIPSAQSVKRARSLVVTFEKPEPTRLNKLTNFISRTILVPKSR